MPSDSDQAYADWYPRERPAPPQDTFEIGLVLAGAVSAGAYTAGVLDFLFEALDRWHLAKADDVRNGRTGDQRTVPAHNVRLHIITGASAGGMNGAIASVALRHDYPRAWAADKVERLPGEDDGNRQHNPFYSAWVQKIDIRQLLGVSDLDEGLYSLLDCTVLEDIVDDILGYSGPAVPDQLMRSWLPNPLPLILTVTNLRGVPYQILFRGDGNPAHEMSLHQDQMAFAVEGLGPGPAEILPEEFLRLTQPEPANKADWQRLGASALATGAFPGGLRARLLTRRGGDYLTRHPVFSPEDGKVVFDRPAWPDDVVPDAYRFLCVDGGVLNNEPFEIARRALAGMDGHNPRGGTEANRAVVMIDPFIEPGLPGPDADAELPKVIAGMLTALKNQARFTPQDRALIQREDIYSRFLIAPSRENVKGAEAIASGGLGAFMGFFNETYRHHDFMLGRRNCQRFLQASLTLPAANPLFQETWTDAAKTEYADRRKEGQLQIIPCVGPCAVEETLPPWPVGAMTYTGAIEALVERRTDRLVAKVLDQASGNHKDLSIWQKAKIWGTRLYLKPLAAVARKKIKGMAKDNIEAAIGRIDGRGPG